MTRRVGVAARVADGVALLLVCGGAAAYLWAFAGMRALQERRVTAAPGEWLLTRWELYWRTSRWGLGLAAAGVAVGVIAHVVHLVRRRSASPTP